MGNKSNQNSRASVKFLEESSGVGLADIFHHGRSHHQYLVGLSGFWSQHVLSWVCQLAHIPMTCKVLALQVWGLEQEKALQQVQAAVQADPLL